MRSASPRSPVALALAALVLAGCGGDEAPRAAGPGAVATSEVPAPAAAAGRPARALPPADTGAWVRRRTALHARPGGRVVATLGRRTGFGGPQVLAVVARRGPWLGVLHTALPNGRTGWIAARDARLVREPWALVIDRSARRARVLLHGEVVERLPVAVGAPGTDTPLGRFAVTDRIRPPAGSPYGCCALALTGRQPNVPQGWVGGDRLAVHGTSAPASIGTAASAGCVRVGDADLRRLYRRLPVGARVTIVA
jgi:lipoprotein-anchoring transpeptidase ErfK/SrfK